MNPRVSEIFARLDAIELAERELRAERVVLLAELQERQEAGKRKRTPPPVELKFGKNVITWDGGTMYIKGKGYKFVKALYEANGMKLKEQTIGVRVWGYEQSHKNFKDKFYQLQAILEKAKFPYRLLPVMSKEKTVPTGEKYPDGKPKRKHLRPVIIGVKLTTAVNYAKTAVNF